MPMLLVRYYPEAIVLGIVIFAMVALFLGMRLYAVLGKRTGSEQPLARSPEEKLRPVPPALEDGRDTATAAPEQVHNPGAEAGLRAIAAADRSFDPVTFAEGAKAAYRMILEGFWAGKEDVYRDYVSEDVRAAFGDAIAARAEAGHVLDNRLVTIERALISGASFKDGVAEIIVRFDADIAAVTRDTDGKVIAGSLSDAVPTHDAWTFARTLRSDDPNWILTDTDEAS